MANTLKIKRGAAATIPQGQLAEPLFTTDTYDLYIGKGSGGNQRIQNYIASGTSSQFLKGDGSLDSNTYQTALTFSSPLVNTSGTISIPAATGSVNGYLTSTDWTTFNSKEPAITAGTTLQYYRGDKTFQTLDTSVVPENGPIYFTEPRVRATVLTGLNLSGGGTIAATDSILTAFGKVQNQISAFVGGATYQGTWNASTNTPTLASGTGTKGFYYVVSVAGSTNLDGITDWKIGDWAIFNGTTWDKVDNTDAVSSVNGFTGAVNLGLGNISDVTLSSPTNAQLLRFNGTSSKWENWTPTYISGNETITLSGDISGSGTTTIATTIGAGKVTNAMLAGSIAASKLVGTDIATVGTITTGIWNGTTIAIADGGTGATTKAAAFNALSPMTTLGDIIYGGASGAGTRLAGNTTASKRFLIQTGDGTNSAAPSWGSIAAGDVPTLNQNTTGSAATLTTARDFTINGTAKSFDGSANVSWTAAEIGLTSYLPLSGGNLTGDVTMKRSATSEGDYLAKASFSLLFNGNYWNSSTGNKELYTGKIFGIPNNSNVASDPSTRIVVQAGTTDTIYALSTGTIQFPQYTTDGLLKTSSSNGTIAMAVAGTDYVIPSALSSYLPLTGGTLTGALSGTSATFNTNSTSNAGFFQINDATTTLGNSFATVHRNANDGNGRFSLSRWQVQNTSGLDQSVFIGAQAVTGASNYSPNLILGVSNGASSYTTYLTISSTGAATFSSNAAQLLTIASTATNGSYLGFTNSGTLNGAIGTGANIIGTITNSDLGIWSTGAIAFQANGSVRLTIASTGAATFTGRVTAGSSMLLGEVQSSYSLLETTAGNGIWLRPAGGADPTGLKIATTGAATFSSSVTASVASGNGAFYINNASLTNKNWTFLPNTNGTESDLLLYYTGTGAGTKLTITNSGNVGIGTTSPQLNGNNGTFTTIYNGSASGWLELATGSTTDGLGGTISFNNTNIVGTDKRNAQISGVRDGANNSGALSFVTWNAGTGAERMRITSGGNLLIGTSTDAGATYKLQLYRGASSSNYMRIYTDNGAYDSAIEFTDTVNAVYCGNMRGSTALTGAFTIWTGGAARVNVTSGNGTGSIVLIGKTATNSYPTNTSSLQIDGAAGSLFETSYNGTKGLRVGSDATTEFFHSSRNVPINFFSNNSVNWSLQITANGQVAYTALSPSPNTSTITNTTTATPVLNSSDTYIYIGNSTSAYTLTIANPNGTPTQGQKLLLRFKDNGTQVMGISFGTQFRASSDLALPTTTTAGKTLYCGFIYNSTDTKWDMVALLNNF